MGDKEPVYFESFKIYKNSSEIHFQKLQHSEEKFVA